MPRRILVAAAMLFALAGAAGPLAPHAAHADEADAPTPNASPFGSVVDADAPYGFASPSTAEVGERVSLWTAGWPAGTALQAVLCGDYAIGGSSTCHLAGAVPLLSDRTGEAVGRIALGAPPRPCPCVIRVSAVGSSGEATNLPLDLQGHEIGAPPVPEAPAAQMRLDRLRIEGKGGWRSFFGLGGTVDLVARVTNEGTSEGTVPPIEHSFGRDRATLDETWEGTVTVPPQQDKDVVIAADVPRAMFGTLWASVRWADGEGPVLDEPVAVRAWGMLSVLFLLLLSAIGMDVVRRYPQFRSEDPEVPEHTYPLPDVVFLEDIGGYLVKPSVLKNSRVTKRLTGRLTVADLDLLVTGHGKARFADGTPAAQPPAGSGGALATFLRGDRQGDGGRGSGGSFGSGSGLSFFVRTERDSTTGKRSDRPGGSGPGLSFFVRPDRDRDA